MLEKTCPKCEESMVEREGHMALLSSRDVPAFGSKAEIMVTPRETMRILAYVCVNPACRYVEFYAE